MPSGRHAALTEDVLRRVTSLVRAGSSFAVAAQAVGIHPRTAELWRQRGRGELPSRDADWRCPACGERNESVPCEACGAEVEPDSIYFRFERECQKARAEAQVAAVVRINQAGRGGDWRADAWFLARTNPAEWGEHASVHVQHSGDLTVHDDLADRALDAIFDDPALVPLAHRLLERLAAGEPDGGGPPLLEASEA